MIPTIKLPNGHYSNEFVELVMAENKRLHVLAPPVQPVDMILHCPACGLQHIDAPEGYRARQERWASGADDSPAWLNPPHRSHLCREEDGGCGHTWRPADVPTNGVAAIKTKGKADSAAPDVRPRGKYAMSKEQCMAYAKLEERAGNPDFTIIPQPPAPTVPVPWLHYFDVPDALADKALSARVPGGSAVRDWFLPHESDKGATNVRDAMKCALLEVLPLPGKQAGPPRLLQTDAEYKTMLEYTNHLACLIDGNEGHELWPIFQITQDIIMQWEQRPDFVEQARQETIKDKT
jgi:hypothetical protein